ncbi:hypothetical protein AAG570_002676 [Ranatra chinensis]|uniref:MAGE domain-containing protein n=1 Tax=Ranatra chinensis TaxID=642074 RepID=A0ABD0Y8B7_9HEMI
MCSVFKPWIMSFRRKKFNSSASQSQSQSLSQDGSVKRQRRTDSVCGKASSQQVASGSSSQYSNSDNGSYGDDEELVNNIVCFLLAHNLTLKPLKRIEILQCGAASNSGSSSQSQPVAKGKKANDIIKEVGNKLEQVYGLKLVEAEPQKYILVNTLEHDKAFLDAMATPDDTETSSGRVLLLLVLAAMFHDPEMSITEDSLIDFFQKLNIRVKSEDSYFGDVNKKVQEFEKQMYIKKTTVVEDSMASASSGETGTTSKKVVYSWGQRAILEIGKRAVFNFLCKVYNRDAQSMPQTFQHCLGVNGS